MTIFYNDLSSYDAGFVIPAGTPAVVAKATEGVYYHDAQYANFKAQAAKLGVPFSGYHFLKSESSPEAQAAYYHDFAPGVPCMLDVETEGGSRPGVDWVLRFMKALEGLGGRVWGVYYPHWYLSLTGGDLGSVERAGAVIISSFYQTYSDSGDGWLPYGGATPRIWQFKSVPQDTNAFKGSAAELAALINGDDMPLSDADIGRIWDFENPALDNIDMRQYLVNAANQTAQILAAVNALTAKVNSLPGGSVNAAAVADAELAEIKAKL